MVNVSCRQRLKSVLCTHMSRSITLPKSEFDKLAEEVRKLRSEVRTLSTMLKSLLPSSEPVYGSREWWEKEEKEAQEDIRKGRVYGPYSAKEAIKALHSLSQTIED